MITGLLRAFPDQLVGYSDHTLPDEAMTPLVVAHLLGAVVIEKHFTHDKNLIGNDHYHAMDVDDLKRFTAGVGDIHRLLGQTDIKSPISTEDISRRNARRSIVVDRPIKAGEVIKDQDLTYKRPGLGVSPIHWAEIVGRVASRNLTVDEVIQWEDLTPSES
jgi:N-acetylneuraminate synthase